MKTTEHGLRPTPSGDGTRKTTEHGLRPTPSGDGTMKTTEHGTTAQYRSIIEVLDRAGAYDKLPERLEPAIKFVNPDWTTHGGFSWWQPGRRWIESPDGFNPKTCAAGGLHVANTIEAAQSGGARASHCLAVGVKPSECGDWEAGKRKARRVYVVGPVDLVATIRRYGTGANLAGADLTCANLGGAYLTCANLDGAHLYRANLDGANLYRADLGGANLYRAHLAGADLTCANLAGANLTRAHLAGADLRRAVLTGHDMAALDERGATL